MNDPVNAALVRALENLLALAPDLKVNGALKQVAGAVLQDARAALSQAYAHTHAHTPANQLIRRK